MRNHDVSRREKIVTIMEAILLGLIQGLTEFLPVSSSGHLALAKPILGIDAEAGHFTTLVVFVHLGTALSVISAYRQQVGAIVFQTARVLIAPKKLSIEFSRNESFRQAVQIGITLIPTGIAYIFMKEAIDNFFDRPHWVGALLIATGLLLSLTLFRKTPKGRITIIKSLIIGTAQAFAMLPGISRSGATIAAAIYMNVDREQAARFSFLMALPVILAGALLEGRDLLGSNINSAQWRVILLATLVAYLSGLLAIRLVIHVVKRGKLQYFAAYCLVAGALALILL